MVKTTKQLSARWQILAAIEHFHNKNYECAITLAGAGENQIKEKTTTHFFRVIRRKFSGDDANMFYNWMKHPSGHFNAEFEEQEVVTMIIRGIQKYVGAYEETHTQFEKFSDWCIDHKYTKGSLTKEAT
jgi:hypothetical protein